MKLLFLMLVGIVVQQAIAQEKPNAFIINNDNDTIQGFIPYRETSDIYRECQFKLNQSDQSKVFYPGQIKGYGYHNYKYFESKEASGKGAFMELLVYGTISLYKFDDTFYVEKEKSLQKLRMESEEILQDGKIMLKKNKHYQGVLKYFMADCNKASSNIETVSLFEKSLVKIVSQYNNCNNENSNVVLKNDLSYFKTKVNIYAGYNHANLRIKSVDELPDNLSNFHASNSYLLGLGFNFSSPRISRFFSLQLDLLYSQSRFLSFNNYVQVYSTNNYTTLELSQFNIPLTIEYQFFEKTYSPFIRFGAANNLNFTKTNRIVYEYMYPDNIIINKHVQDPFEMDKMQFGYSLSLGVKRKINSKSTMTLEFRHEQLQALKNTFAVLKPLLYPEITNFQLLLSIKGFEL